MKREDLRTIIDEATSIDDAKATGRAIKLALLHFAAQMSGICLMFLKNFLFTEAQDWKTILGNGIFGGMLGNAFLHISTPNTQAVIFNVKKQLARDRREKVNSRLVSSVETDE